MSCQLMSYLNGYSNSTEMSAFQAGLQVEADLAWRIRDELLAQLDPNTATWGLDKWEAAFGIAVDSAKDIDQRRSKVVAKIRGNGTTTAELIRAAAESFSGAAVDVVELPGECRIEIHFSGSLGLPPNFIDFSAMLNEIIPAHLAWETVIYYRTQGEVATHTHDELESSTHAAIREEDIS